MSGKPGFRAVPTSAMVTGGSGFVGRRLVEMLVERGCKRVVSFDIVPKPADAAPSKFIEYVQGDICDKDVVIVASKGVECIFHIAALVGPYHPLDKYIEVNYNGSVNMLEACKANNIKKLVQSSSPSTRFPYPDPNVRGLTEAQLFRLHKKDYPDVFQQRYAESKALGEKAILDAGGSRAGELLTIAVAPHQVYGPRDALFLPALLVVNDKLRVMGSGKNTMSFCHVDNYCHGLILGAEALYPHSPALSKYYVVTDNAKVQFWDALEKAYVALGFTSLFAKFRLPYWFMLSLGYLGMYLAMFISFCTGQPLHKVNFWIKLHPFSVKMLMIDRYFSIDAAIRDLHYEPLISFDEGWTQTIDWFKENWLPGYLESKQGSVSGDNKIKQA
jgi:nucleoside-diphosphate-sugar epimerase